jgi:hypothetical protein
VRCTPGSRKTGRVRSQDESMDAQARTRRRPRRRSDGGIEAVATLQGRLGRRKGWGTFE